MLTSILIGYQTADPGGYKEWAEEFHKNLKERKAKLYKLLTRDKLSPSYYMLGWQCVCSRGTLQEAYGAGYSCIGNPAQQHKKAKNPTVCKVNHSHRVITEHNSASTG